jgi:tetratricopeptide (TPR) repeat protein
MMRNLMEIDNLSSTIREKIVHKVDGNPFFLEEIMRSLIDTGAVVHDSSTGRWKTTEKIDIFTMPDTIQGVIMARVDRLGEEIKQVLRTAAVIGRSFLYRILKTIAEEVRELDRDLDQLQTVELIRIKQKIPELEYIFKHALVQETTYGSILLQRRRELHSKVGQAIEALFPDRLEEFYSLLAYHYVRAENWEKAQEYLFKAGDQAGKIAADAEALTHYQEAIETYTRVFGDKWDPIQRGSLERKMGEAFYRRGEYKKAMEYLQRALVYLGRPSLPTSRSKIGLGILGEIAVQIVHHIFSRWLIKKTYGPVDPAAEEVVRIYQIVESIDGVTGAPEHLLLGTLKCVNFAERKGHLPGAGAGYAGLGLAAFVLSLPRLSRFFLQRAVAVSEKIRDPAAIFALNMIFALTGFYEGKLKRAIEHGFKGAEDYRGSGYRNMAVYGYTVMFTSLAYINQGDFSRALTLAQELIHFGEDGNDFNTYVVGLLPLGDIQERKGEFEESIATLKKGIELSEAIPMHEGRVWDGYILGRCYLRLGDLERSLDILTETNNWMAKHHFKGLNPIVVSLGFLQVYLAAAEQAAERKREEWLRKARRVCKKLLRSAKVKPLFLPEAIRLQGNYQWLRRRPSFAKKCWERSLGLAEEMGMRYELGMTHLEMGKRLKDRRHLEQAEKIFSEIGAEFDLQEARKLLKVGSM